MKTALLSYTGHRVENKSDTFFLKKRKLRKKELFAIKVYVLQKN
jgi:hypothetical protein